MRMPLAYMKSAITYGFLMKLRAETLRDLGAALSPFNAFLIAQGLETLPVRMPRHVSNALAVAEWLEGNDAVDWVSLPNTLGMSQHGDGGVVGTKPYSASGAYIHRMSDHCAGCRYDPKQATGDRACPFTTLYWDFLSRHQERFSSNRRMAMQLRNLGRKDGQEVKAIVVPATDAVDTEALRAWSPGQAPAHGLLALTGRLELTRGEHVPRPQLLELRRRHPSRQLRWPPRQPLQ